MDTFSRCRVEVYSPVEALVFGWFFGVNPETLNPKPLNPKPLNPKPLNP